MQASTPKERTRTGPRPGGAVRPKRLGPPVAATWRRRALTIPAVFLGLLAWLVSTPVVAPALALLDVATRRTSLGRTRTWAWLGGFLVLEVYGIAASLVLWLRAQISPGLPRATWWRWHRRLQHRWGSLALRWTRALLGLNVALVEGGGLPLGPFVLLVRHASLVDTLLPVSLVSLPHDRPLRYIMKEELLFDPCLDIVGGRLPNHFVARAGGDPEAEAEAAGALAAGMGPREGLALFPEGTRFTEARRRARIQRYEATGRATDAARARSFSAVLPPRSRGFAAIMEARPDLDVVILAHAGLAGAARPRDFARGDLVGRRAEVALWRYPSADVPRGDEACAAWLDARWAEVDAWVIEHTPQPPS